MRTEDRGQRTEDTSVPLVVDLFSGTGGATAAAEARPLMVWASPPCQEFSRWSMPWCRAKNPPPPSLELLRAALRFIQDARPEYWIIENVRGAVPFFRPVLGEPRAICGPFYLWGEFPRPERVQTQFRREHFGSKQRVQRAAVPREISEAVFAEIEAEARFFKYAA